MTRRAVRFVVVTALLGVHALASERVWAYCIAKACDDVPAYDDVWQSEPDPPCTRDSVGCLLEGQLLHWPATCISYTVQRDGSKSDGISFETATAIIDQAFATWQAANCGGGLASIEVQDLGAVSCNHIEYNQTQPNANVFLFRDKSWHREVGEDTLALTTVTYNTENAEIYDADVEINTFDDTFTTTDDQQQIQIDLASVVTHEVGHFLGLSHSLAPKVTMSPDYYPGETRQRVLSADDIAGICAIYPPGRTVNADQCTPRHGFSGECATKDDGCTLSRDSSTGHVAWPLSGLALFGALVVLRRRRR